MRLATILVVFVVTQSCAPLAEQLRYSSHAEQKKPTQEPGILPDGSKYYVPLIHFDGEVDADNVAQALIVISAVQATRAKAIVLELNTPGGNADVGFMLVKAIEESHIPVICVVDGIAASMGAYILESCHYRIMTKRSGIMIHQAALHGVAGQQNALKTAADFLVVIDRATAEHLARRLNMTPEQILAKCAGGAQWWIGWQEALQVNAVDQVVDDVEEVTKAYRETLQAPQ